MKKFALLGVVCMAMSFALKAGGTQSTYPIRIKLTLQKGASVGVLDAYELISVGKPYDRFNLWLTSPSVGNNWSTQFRAQSGTVTFAQIERDIVIAGTQNSVTRIVKLKQIVQQVDGGATCKVEIGTDTYDANGVVKFTVN